MVVAGAAGFVSVTLKVPVKVPVPGITVRVVKSGLIEGSAEVPADLM